MKKKLLMLLLLVLCVFVLSACDYTRHEQINKPCSQMAGYCSLVIR